MRQYVQSIDYGLDFYAPQTLLAPNERRIMVAWMQNWGTVGAKPYHCRWFGQMTLPRELSVKNGRLIQNPVRELESCRVAKDGEHETIIRYRPDQSTLKLDRTRSGLPHDIVHTRSLLVRPQGGEIKLRVILDRFSVEVFVNDGEQTASAVIYTQQSAGAITFEAGGSAVIDVEKYDLVL